MPKSENQKLKLLYILKFLYEKTDEQHAVTVNDIISELEKNDIKAARRAIYDDLRLLSEYGIDIVKRKDRTYGYYIGERAFELAEVKLLVDCVQATKFITKKKSAELIKKLGTLASKSDASKLNRQVFLAERVKSMNESIYYAIDAIHTAITENKQVSFLYFDYNVKNERIFRRDGQKYISNPAALTFDNGNYYLIDYNEKYNKYTHYRVDRMSNIDVLNSRRTLPEQRFDVARYVNSVFYMFGGEVEAVTVEFQTALYGSVKDRFGSNFDVIGIDGDHFKARFKAAVSPAFIAWLVGYGNGAKVISPQHIKEQVCDFAKDVLKLYE